MTTFYTLHIGWTQIRHEIMSRLIWIQIVETRMAFLKICHEYENISYKNDDFEREKQQTTERVTNASM